jgi:hypothetical protein
VREKERQLRPDPRRPCRMKAVAVGGFSRDSWISSKARVSVSGASELTDKERRRRRGHQAEEHERRRERREDAIRRDAAMSDSFAGSAHHGGVAKGTSWGGKKGKEKIMTAVGFEPTPFRTRA